MLKRILITFICLAFVGCASTGLPKKIMSPEDYMKLGEQTMANQKFTQLPEDTAPTSDDIVVTANDPGGTPVNKKVTLANLFGVEDVIFKASFGNQDWGDISVSGNVVSLNADVVGVAEMADADHGDISWLAGVATIDPGVILVSIGVYDGDYDAAVLAIGAIPTTLYVDEAATMSTNVTTPATLATIILKGGSIDQAGSTLTTNGPLIMQGGSITNDAALNINGSFPDPGPIQVFTSTGTVSFGTGAVPKAYPQWWGENTTPGTTDMTAEIQAAFDSGIEHVYISDGTYMIEATENASPTDHGLTVPSNIKIEMSQNTILKAIGNDHTNSAVLGIYNVSNVIVTGGAVEGERYEHIGETGEWGHCIDIRASSRVKIEGVYISKSWGDGIYLGDIAGTRAEDILILNNYVEYSRRNNLSIVHAFQVTVKGNTFKSANGTDPQMGIDIEPDTGDFVYGCIITENSFISNQKAGARIEGTSGSVKHITISHNYFSGNSVAADATQAAIIAKNANNANIIGNVIFGEGQQGIRVTDFTRISIIGNNLYQTDLTGIHLKSVDQGIVQGNTVHQAGFDTNDTYDGIYAETCNETVISGNIVVLGGSGNNVKYGLNVSGGTEIFATNNILNGVTAALIDSGSTTVYYRNNPVWQTTFTDADTTPSVTGVEYGLCVNTGATAITAFDNGSIGQEIIVRIDANSTITSGARLLLAGGANFTGDSNDLITLFCVVGGAASAFREVSRSVN